MSGFVKLSPDNAIPQIPDIIHINNIFKMFSEKENDSQGSPEAKVCEIVSQDAIMRFRKALVI